MVSFKFYIRPTKITELEKLHTISVQTFKETFEAKNTEDDMAIYLKHNLSKKKLNAEFSDRNTSFYFAYCDEVLVGYLKLNFKDAQKKVVLKGKAYEIERIYILKAHQGRGFGTQLFNEALGIGRGKGYKLMWLGVWELNHKALKFYKKKGLKAFDSHIFQLGNDSQTDILMQLKF